MMAGRRPGTPVTEQEFASLDFAVKDTWRIFRIMAEFVEGFEALAQKPAGVTVFGSARSQPGDADYELGVRHRPRARPGRATPSSPAADPATWRRPTRGRARPEAASVGVCIELPNERPNPYVTQPTLLPLLLRAQGDVRQVQQGLRHPAGGVRHAGRAVRGGHARPDAQGPPFPIVLAGNDGYWDGLVDWVNGTVVRRGMVSPHEATILQRADTPEDVLAIIERAEREAGAAGTRQSTLE